MSVRLKQRFQKLIFLFSYYQRDQVDTNIRNITLVKLFRRLMLKCMVKTEFCFQYLKH